jgi:hypothetical protein
MIMNELDLKLEHLDKDTLREIGIQGRTNTRGLVRNRPIGKQSRDGDEL